METQEKILLTAQNLKWTDDRPTNFYANIIGVSMTPFDISILCGEIGSATTSEIQVIPRFKVSMAPELIPGLIQTLTDTLKTYVENNGGLRSPRLPDGPAA